MPITAKVDAGFTRAMNALRAEVRAPSSATRDAILKRVADLDGIQNTETFAEERDPVTGQAWETLEEENKGYAAWKRRNLPGRKMLVWNGRLRDSTRHAKAEGRIARWSGQTIQLGTSDPNAVKHQQGETYSPPRIVYLREKTPQFPKGARRKQLRGRSGRFSGGHGMFQDVERIVGVGRVRDDGSAVETTEKVGERRLKGRRWFTLYMRRLPARPFIGKTKEQADALRDLMASQLLRQWERVTKQAGASRLLATASAGRLKVR